MRASAAPEAAWRALLVEQVRGAVRAGVSFVHVRERDLEARVLLDLVEALVEAAAGTPTRILVNDRLDVALVSGAAGVHLRADSPHGHRLRPAADVLARRVDARRARVPLVISRAVHGPGDLPAAAGADLMVAGTVFPSQSKAEAHACLDAAGLQAIVTAAAGTPVLAIGGITPATVPAVAAAGVRGVAAIGAFLPVAAGLDVAAAAAAGVENLRIADQRRDG